MKEIITSWILLAGMVILFFINSYTVSTVSADMCDGIEKLCLTIESENFEKAEAEIKVIKEKWQKSCKKLIHIFSHTQLEEIERLILMTEVHLINKESDDAILKLEEIKYRIIILGENEKITLDNIF